MKLRWLLIAFAVALLAGCTELLGTSVPTPYPTEYIPTVIALTVQAGYSPTPTGVASSPQGSPSPQASATPLPRPTHTPTRVESPQPSATQRQIVTPPTATRRPSKTPTITLTPTLVPASIQIINPGPASKVVSPLTFQAYVQPGARGIVLVELLGEKPDSPPLYRETVNLGVAEGRVYFSREIEFEIAGVSEIGRLQISAKDSYGRLIALNSVDLILLSVGEADVTSGGDLLDPIIIRQPVANTLIQGGTLTVSGMARPGSDLPLLVELVAANGTVVGYRQASVTPSADGSHVHFSVEVAYTVTGPTWVRLIVREESTGRIAGTIHLSSVEVLLGP